MGIPDIVITVIIALVIGIILGPLTIPILRRLKFGQQIRSDGPQAHLKKAGTPTMGGVMIMIAFAIAFFRVGTFTWEMWLILLATLGFGFVGFLDDYLKIVRKQSLGLTAKQKLVGQLFVTFIIWIVLIQVDHPMSVQIPMTDIILDFGVVGYGILLVLMFLGTSNAVNFTDGLDGLLAGSTAIAMTAYAVIGMSLSLPDVAFGSAALIGAALAFLVYNAHPAKVFMGDTGSLGIGGCLAMMAVLTHTELLLIIIGGLFVVEMLSVILQVGSFKLRGKRIFRMSPIHHHFELVGWSEWRVVLTFWTFGFICALLGIWIQKGM